MKEYEMEFKEKCLLSAVGAEGSGNFQKDIRDFSRAFLKSPSHPFPSIIHKIPVRLAVT